MSDFMFKDHPIKLIKIEEIMKQLTLQSMMKSFDVIKQEIKFLIDTMNNMVSNTNPPIKKQYVKRPWMNYKLPKVLMDATSKRGFTQWKDLTTGSKNGFRHKILLWSLPKVNNTYKKRIKTILNQYYV